MRSRREERQALKEQDISHVNKLRLRYNLLGILVLIFMGVLVFDLGGAGTWITRILGGNI